MIKFNYTHGICFAGGIVLTAIIATWAAIMDEGMSKPPKKDLNDIRIEQHAKCLEAGMKSKLDREDNLICEPNTGLENLREYWDRRAAEKVVAEKTGTKPKKDTGWPVDPNSFETKSKRTE